MKQLDSKAVWLFFLGSLFRLMIFSWVLGVFLGPFLIGGFFMLIQNSESTETSFSFFSLFPLFLLYIIVIVLGSYIWAKLSYKFYKYEITDAGFRKESGVIYKRYVTIPYDRIQNVDIYRGIVARVLNLSDLQIQTAGVSGRIGAEGRLPGLSKEVAEQLRDELIQRARQSKNQGL